MCQFTLRPIIMQSIVMVIVCHESWRQVKHVNITSISFINAHYVPANINPFHAEFLKWNNPHCPLSFYGISRWELEVGQPTV